MPRFAPTFFAGLAAYALGAGTANATAEMDCQSIGSDDVAVQINLPRSGPIRPNWVRVAVDNAQWSTLGDEGATPVNVLQSYDDGREYTLELSEDGGDAAIIVLRVMSVDEGDTIHRIGYLHVAGRSVHPVTCEDTE